MDAQYLRAPLHEGLRVTVPTQRALPYEGQQGEIAHIEHEKVTLRFMVERWQVFRVYFRSELGI